MAGIQATVVLDSGAIIALSRGDRRLRGRLNAVREQGDDVSVPVVVVAETTRGSGPRDAATNRVLADLGPADPLDESTARLAGRLLAESGSSATVDALVVAHAIKRAPAAILTGDHDDLTLLLGRHPLVSITRV